MSDSPAFPAWRFVEHHPEAKSRDPLQSELLNQESFNPADALVRESIQNSLDAKLPGVGNVRVRIYVSGDSGALSPEEAAPYFRGFWPHVRECENGGQVASDLVDQPCRFVVIEDFNTVGLTGDPAATRVAADVSNNYYYFLRAEGISKKESNSLGRWGVGKYVFPKTSGVNAFFAYTNREGDPGNGLLVGQTVLMNHSVDGTDYDPDGWWARPGTGVQMPITDPQLVGETATRWKVSRTSQTGLSIVIPYVDAMLTSADFVRAVIRAYCGAVLSDGLIVEIEDPGGVGPVQIDSGNVLTLAKEYFEGDECERIVAEIQLMAARSFIPEESRFTTGLVAGGAGQGWSSSTIDADQAARIRALLETGEAVQVTVPIELRLKEQRNNPILASFEVLLQQDESLRQRPLYMRGGIVISDAARFTMAGIRAICIVEDDPLTKMLGDAENPAHTTWTVNDKIKARYIRGAETLALVKTAPRMIHELVLDAALEEQRIVFADIFAVPIEDPDEEKKNRGRSKRRKIRHVPGVTPRVLPLTVIQREEQGGFSILPTDHGRSGTLKRVDVVLGYASRRGDAVSKWRKEDFDLTNFSPVVVGGTVEKKSGNFLAVSVHDAEHFKLTLLGFDTNRDLQIRARGHSK